MVGAEIHQPRNVMQGLLNPSAPISVTVSDYGKLHLVTFSGHCSENYVAERACSRSYIPSAHSSVRSSWGLSVERWFFTVIRRSRWRRHRSRHRHFISCGWHPNPDDSVRLALEVLCRRVQDDDFPRPIFAVIAKSVGEKGAYDLV